MAYPWKRPAGDSTRVVEPLVVAVEPLEEVGMVDHVSVEPTSHGFYGTVAKPLLDRISGVVMSILTFPLVMIIVPGIWLTLGRPAIYRQRRIGYLGREFTVYKFRTMRTDRRLSIVAIAHSDRRVNHKSEDDPRHVPYGRFLRRWSLDEIPQFWNVARGEMSFVGPRPELPFIVGNYADWQHRRHAVKPGLTGLWQISARGEIPMHEATHIDIEYVDSVSFREDTRIVLNTPAAMFGQRQGE